MPSDLLTMVVNSQASATTASTGMASLAATSAAAASSQASPFVCQYLAPYSHLVEMPWLSPFMFELLALVAGLTSLALQVCNIYKTAWWLPYSDSEYPLSLEKIDYNVTGLACLLVLRRVTAFFCRVAVDLSHKNDKNLCSQMLLVIVSIPVVAFLGSMAFFLFQLSHSYPAERFGYLLFPIVTYVLLFGFNIKPLYSTGICYPYELGRSTIHVCSSVPVLCRAECSELAADFNTRVAHLFFNSAVTVFYAAIIPLLFPGQELIFYDEIWAGHIIFLSFLTQLSLYCAYYLPCRYIDIMQRCAAHLGRWKRLDSPIPASFWSDSQAWASGAIVRHSGKVYRALCPFNAAIPGYNLHIKFHMLFSSPVRFYGIPMVCALWTLSYSLFELVFFAYEWHQCLGVGLLTLSNGASAFYLLRGRYILHWTNEKHNTLSSSESKSKES